ncbi:DUF1146 family protein [Agrilactobacillus yilanensis]|uniref:DUF1146 family protein n=1 Tax=Agrilactobacillus yilanensis TaxID=2485997 RepID=A0ABW4J5J9_9LACO|nr:DUF1146 family protein [Agrilactobacillus yilanensis]
MKIVGLQAVYTAFSHIFFIVLTFWAIRSLRFDALIKRDHVPQAQLILVFLAIAIGYNVSSFFLSLVEQAHNFIYLLH